ncbi:single-stranded DNA-binding protein [Bacteroidales bacterium OttesenSCG-928-K03]|nr:single-stranded DNA-binding protein [Odoribacter sp. OttesenSCG-928-L07]MDL2242820.1 single-stranded DNA-binding protein [Bacteroidales bacterium OttesenSCG-928-K03]
MANSLNKILLIGNLGKDPEVRTSETWKNARFSLATNEDYKNKNGDKVTHTEWHNIIVWRGLADIAEKYLKKGDRVYIEGRIRSRTYEQDGVEKRFTDIEAETLIMLDKPDNQSQMQQQMPPQDLSNVKVNMEPPTSADDDLPF